MTAKKEKVLVRPAKYADEPKVDLVACERELRGYIKRDGSGFRKDISEAGKNRAKQMLKLLKRKELVWDENIIPV